jgi:hypothetical protein
LAAFSLLRARRGDSRVTADVGVALESWLCAIERARARCIPLVDGGASSSRAVRRSRRCPANG